MNERTQPHQSAPGNHDSNAAGDSAARLSLTAVLDRQVELIQHQLEERTRELKQSHEALNRLRHSASQLEKRERQAAIVATLGRSALAGTSLGLLFDHAVAEIAAALDSEYCKVLELLPSGEEFLLINGIGWNDGIVGTARIPTGENSQAGYTLQCANPVIVSDLRHETRFSGPALLLDHSVVSGMSVVIGPPDHPWGVLGTHSTRAVHYTIDDANFFQAIANILWDAISRKKSEADAHESAERMRLAAEAASFGTYDVDPTSGSVHWSAEMNHICGIPKDTALPIQISQIPIQWVHPDDRERAAASIYRSLNSRHDGTLDEEYRIIRPDGKTRWIQVCGRTLFESVGGIRRPVRATGTIVDITDRKTIELELKELNENLEQRVEKRTSLIELLHRVTAACHNSSVIDDAINYVLREFAVHSGWCFGHAFRPSEEDQDELIPFPDCYEEYPGRFERFRKVTINLRLRRGEGLPGRVFATGKPEFVADHLQEKVPHRREEIRASGIKTAAAFPILVGEEAAGVLEFFSDQQHEFDDRMLEAMNSIGSQLGRIVERVRLQREIADVTSQEQNRIGSELHDTVMQQLTGCAMIVESMRQSVADGVLPAESIIADLAETLKSARQELRQVQQGLMPVDLDASGLMAALQKLATNTTRRHGVECRFARDADILVPNATTANYLYRIAQEAVHNAVKHAHATSIQVTLTSCEQIRLAIRDDGKGMSSNLDQVAGSGLRIMRHRAQVIGGRLHIESKPGQGTTVVCNVIH